MASLYHAFRTPLAAQPPDQTDLVVAVHTAVHGRVRLQVRGLRGSTALARCLEQTVSGVHGIVSAHASATTGRILVLFTPDRDAVQVMAIVESAVKRASADDVAQSGARPPRLPPVLAPARPIVGRGPGSTARAAGVPWHTYAPAVLVQQLATSPTRGISSEQAVAALAAQGPNVLAGPRRRSDIEILMSQFASLPTGLLAASALLSLLTGGIAEAVVVIGVIALNAGIGFLTESASERTIASLQTRDRHPALLIRDGALIEVDARAVVKGDLLVLQPGHYVPADARLLECRDLTLDESMLTGESMPVRKATATLADRSLALADRRNMVHMGTIITGGSGLALAVATGARTEIGTIQALLGDARAPQTPMQRQLEQLGNQMVWLSLGICGAVFGLGLLRGYGAMQMLRSAVSLAVAAVPEGLPTVATTTLALGIRSMRQRSVLVGRLDAVETLGSVQVICLDKTGTLTSNRMAVLAIHAGMERLRVNAGVLTAPAGPVDPCRREELLRLLHVAVLCSEVQIDDDARSVVLSGSATEVALVELGLACGVDVRSLRARHPRMDVIYRADGRNWMATQHRVQDDAARCLVAVKGSPREVLAMSRYALRDGARVVLDDAMREAILRENDRMSGEALRVLGFAYATLDAEASIAPGGADWAGELVWSGLAGMADPLRKGVKELIALFHQAGIRTVMITGDQSGTAQAIGRALDLSGEAHLETLDSSELDRIDSELLGALAEKVDVYSRVSPSHKLQIVQALQRTGHVVAMTGDGVNDSPALKAADIGVAMGRSGTELARSVADIVLEDDELRTMIVAVKEGRTIYGNIRKSVHFLTATNLSEIAVMLAATAAGIGEPLAPLQLLWINLLTDVAPALALAVEPAEPDVLTRPPRDPREPIIGRPQLLRYGVEALTMTAGTMAAYGFGRLRYGPGPRASTLAFNTLTLAQLMHAYSCRSDRLSVFRRGGRMRNGYLDVAAGGSVLLQAATFLPPLRGLLRSAWPIAPIDLVTIASGAALPFLFNEAAKHVLPAAEPLERTAK